jgi:hypothetical protein
MATVVACLFEVSCLGNETVFINLRGSVNVRVRLKKELSTQNVATTESHQVAVRRRMKRDP